MQAGVVLASDTMCLPLAPDIKALQLPDLRLPRKSWGRCPTTRVVLTQMVQGVGTDSCPYTQVDPNKVAFPET